MLGRFRLEMMRIGFHQLREVFEKLSKMWELVDTVKNNVGLTIRRCNITDNIYQGLGKQGSLVGLSFLVKVGGPSWIQSSAETGADRQGVVGHPPVILADYS